MERLYGNLVRVCSGLDEFRTAFRSSSKNAHQRPSVPCCSDMEFVHFRKLRFSTHLGCRSHLISCRPWCTALTVIIAPRQTVDFVSSSLAFLKCHTNLNAPLFVGFRL